MVTDQDFQKLTNRVVQLEGQVAFLYKHLGIEFVPESLPTDDPRIIEQLKKGDKIGAIRLHREIYGSGLLDATTAINEMQGRLGL